MALLDGKVALVTGAGRGLGRCHAELLAEKGARVVVNDLGAAPTGEGSDQRPAQQVVEAIEEAGGEAVANYGDVTSAEDAQGMIQQAVDEFGGLDILVNNAGNLRDRMSFNMEPDEWDAVIAVHLRGHYLAAHFAGAYWRQQSKETDEPQQASIIQTSSRSGLYGNVGQLNYGAAKAGIAGMTLILSKELSRYGVRCNAIAPIARTRLTKATPGLDTEGEEDFDFMAPENVSPLVAYLASDLAEDVSGQVFIIGGEVVQWMEGWSPRNEIRSGNERWTVEALDEAAEDLFRSKPTGPPERPELDLHS